MAWPRQTSATRHAPHSAAPILLGCCCSSSSSSSAPPPPFYLCMIRCSLCMYRTASTTCPNIDQMAASSSVLPASAVFLITRFRSPAGGWMDDARLVARGPHAGRRPAVGAQQRRGRRRQGEQEWRVVCVSARVSAPQGDGGEFRCWELEGRGCKVGGRQRGRSCAARRGGGSVLQLRPSRCGAAGVSRR